jgi:hypothetical protein
MPFTSNLLGEYGGNPLAVDIFALNLLLASLASLAKYCWLLMAVAPWAADRWSARRARADAG